MITFKQFLFEQKKGKQIVVYPGRFQPMFTHHKRVYDILVSQFGRENTYIATSDDTKDLNSPLNFDLKKKVMTEMLNVPANKILQRVSPYRVDLYDDIKKPGDILFFALGEKDQQTRFPFNNIKNGVNYKKDGISPTAIQPESALSSAELVNIGDYAFIKIIDNIESAKGVMKATDFRTAIRNAETFEEAKNIFFNAYGAKVNDKMDDVIFKIRAV